MPPKKIYLAFDVDGTIYDPQNILAPAFQEGLESFQKKYDYNFHFPTKDEIVSLLGKPFTEIFKKFFPQLDKKPAQELISLCTQRLIKKVNQKKGSLYQKAKVTLETLQQNNYSLFMASNGKIEYTMAILKTFGLIKFFSPPFLAIDNKNIKNKTDIIRSYKKIISPSDLLIMIGDRSTDKIAAQDNNLPFLACSFGYGSPAEIGDSQWTATKFSEIPEIIQKIEHDLL